MNDNKKSTIKANSENFVSKQKKALILAEKPSVGRDIARVLGCKKKDKAYHENDRYIVTWALGHLITLAAPEKYNKSYSEWKMEYLPMLPNPFKLEVISNTSRQYYEVRKLMERKDVNQIIIATDAGREGELVARWILEYARCKKPIKRLWISSVTDKAIKDGFKSLVDGNRYNRLYYAAYARAKADWIVGINGTRALTSKHNASLSMGRVQTPTLGLVREREEEITGFQSKNYYEIPAQANGVTVKWKDKKNQQGRIFDKAKAESIAKKCRDKEATVKEYSEKIKKSYPKGLYDLTELQRDANRLYGFSAKQTLNGMQTLYERHKALTYPRTDSKYLTKDIVPTLHERVRAVRRSGWKEVCKIILKQPIQGNKAFVNDEKVGDHHGIIPTEQEPDYSAFSPNEQKIYNLVLKRFLAVLLPPYEYKEISFAIECEGETFYGKSVYEIKKGWRMIENEPDHYNNDQIKSEEHIHFTKGSTLQLNGAKIAQGKTAPPSYLTEGELLGEMEKRGLGTVATRSDIIEKIIDNHYVEKQNQSLRTTKTGRQLLELVPEAIRTSKLTSKWEQDLEAIAKGNMDDKMFMEEMVRFTKEVINEIKADDQQFRHENVSTTSCPNCGQKLLVVSNKYGKKLVCRDRNCGYKQNLSKTTNARCPQCHKKLELVGEGDAKTFVCRCGYKEKMSAFNKRVEGKKKQMSKREVDKYLKQSNKQEETFNNPFANLLKDIEK